MKSPKLYALGMVLSMLIGMVIAACLGPAPAPLESAPEAATEAAPVEQAAKSTLSAVQERGRIICAGNNALPGFGYVDEAGKFSGFDVDFCAALAAAIFGDSTKFEIRPVTASERFTVLQSGEADVLIRNTTWTMSRDTDLGGNLGPVNFYDGQGILVRKDSGIKTLQDLNGGSVCVQTGTTTELNLADQMAVAGVEYEPVVFETPDDAMAAYEEGRCDAFTSDKSQLLSRQSITADPAAHEIMDVTLSKEPLAPMVRHGDDQWFDIVKWTFYATMLAEEYGVSMENVDTFKETTSPDIRRLLGLEGEFGKMLGLSNEWAYNVIKQVGNYGDIYDRNLGAGSVFNLPRGLNALYTQGGLMYAPPIR